jgi:ABC-2 type transport system permease protein
MKGLPVAVSTSHRSATGYRQPRVPVLLRSVGLKSIWDQRTSLLWWAGGTALMSAIVIMLYPSIDGGEELEALFEQMPPAIRAMMGEEIDLSTAAGYLDLRMFTAIAPIIFLVYAIGRGNGAIAGEENRGTMDLLLSQPVKRWRIVVENALAMLVGLSVVGIAIWGGLVVGALIMDVEFSLTRAGLATGMGVLLGMTHGTLALALGGHTGRTGLTIGVSAAVGIAGYFLQTLASLVDWLEPFQILSPFHYYIGQSTMLQGFNGTHALILTIISVALVAVGVLAFQRRDVQV